MKHLKKLSLQKEVTKEAEEIEKEVSSHPELEDLKVSDEMETSLFNKIQEYEYDRRFKVVYHKKKKRRYIIFALAAVIVLVVGSAITGVGSKSYWKVVLNRIMGDASASVTNVEDMDEKKTDDINEVGVYREINEKFGIAPVRLGYKLPKMELIDYDIDANQGKAILFYSYNSEILRYSMYMNNTDSSFTQKDLDLLINEYDIQNNAFDIHVREYDIEDSSKKRYTAEFEYHNVQYQLMGSIEKENFDKILKNLFFTKK
ncbi:DUF4367 domain-containing protein [Mediterraneibacter glycyrrhizinilyticus]|uniref:DUF4367 domain-containing protein n=1 Tax=Mediterraneibacter glycyrrhizinilyticus TaxID=342942 RepID=UPI00195FBAE9|nr:DUF4367 domain-containing protein [Mediterraneibacter glycyrrhizinilyticus]MBM6752233.1 DUF4367 domain-containing protein [Mediterraneibacter glycyrrhizinilyticus]